MKEQIKNEFETINIFCEPIFGYHQNINEDNLEIYRVYRFWKTIIW